MGETTGISWTDRTASPWHGCAKVSPGCDNCYAAAGAKRNPGVLGVWGQDGTRVPSKSHRTKLLRWNEEAEKAGTRFRVFPSVCDPFEDFPGLDPLRADFLALCEETPHLIHLLLTKRPENVMRMVPPHWVAVVATFRGTSWPTLQAQRWPHNVWIGTTVEDNKRADERLPHLVDIPAPVRFVSVEPQLEHVDLRRWMVADMRQDGGGVARLNQLHWVIQGGESGPNARPFDMAWARSMRDQCAAAGVPYFFKQTGARVVSESLLNDPPLPPWLPLHRAGADPAEWPEDLRIQEVPHG